MKKQAIYLQLGDVILHAKPTGIAEVTITTVPVINTSFVNCFGLVEGRENETVIQYGKSAMVDVKTDDIYRELIETLRDVTDHAKICHGMADFVPPEVKDGLPIIKAEWLLNWTKTIIRL